ncbi:MAG TPA: polyprenyl synthetase family protein [Nitrososphaeraceae archaeon]|nr:polyprenyl synthetase family protein [Nitrososphaeraceae archaeon]
MRTLDIDEEIESTAAEMDKYILARLKGTPTELYSASAHYINSGGKRLRPFMVVKACEMFEGTKFRALPAAASVELIHNFSLVHDDIMDNDDVRHNVPTVHRSYGVPLAILAGDVLFSKAYQMIVENCSKLDISNTRICDMVSRLSNACVDVCEGQALDLGMALGDRFVNEQEYISMITKKTAALFGLSCALGVLSAPVSTEKDVSALSQFGKNVGVAFQLIDDLIGVIGDARLTGKSVGNDLREGKKTLPILLALKMSSIGIREKILRVFASRNASRLEIEDAVTAISSLGIEEAVRDNARQHIQEAMESISHYDDSMAKRKMVASAFFIVERKV